MEELKIKTKFFTSNNEIIIVELGGYIDQTNSSQVEKIISDILNSGKNKIIFDMSDLIYMSSAGWGIFVGEIKNIRDQGGDIKLAAMSPEVYEVFQMLEFYHIIKDFVSVEEAVNSYMDINKQEEMRIDAVDNSIVEDDGVIDELLKASGVGNVIEEDDNINISSKMNTTKVTEEKTLIAPRLEPQEVVSQKPQKVKKIDIANLPMTEKIKRVVANYPLLSAFQIKRMLKHEKFGRTKIGILRLYRMLHLLNLETKAKRYRYYRSV